MKIFPAANSIIACRPRKLIVLMVAHYPTTVPIPITPHLIEKHLSLDRQPHPPTIRLQLLRLHQQLPMGTELICQLRIEMASQAFTDSDVLQINKLNISPADIHGRNAQCSTGHPKISKDGD
ncbi:MAG: hypothetical protein VKI83_04430 [Synechococcaceae cyanobacterium]|nr:hypothetical protein [Synechococcaceae cyanobacterium]